MSKDVTIKNNADGTSTMFDKKTGQYAGKLPSESSMEAPSALAESRKAKLDALQLLIKQAKDADMPQETLDGMYDKVLELMREAEAEGEEIPGYAEPGVRPATINFGGFKNEEDKIEDFHIKYQQNRPKNRDFDISEGANYTQSALSSLAVSVQEGLPVMLWSKPGTGKTQTVIGLARALDAELIDLNGAQSPADELFGLSYIAREEGAPPEEASAPKIPPAWMRRIQNNPHKRFIVFLDEFSNAPPAVRAALLTLIQDRKAGEHLLGNNVTFVAAGNPVDHATNGFELAPADSNRFMHIDYDIPQEEALEGIEKGWYNPPKASCYRADYDEQKQMVRSLIVGFQKAGGAMHDMPTEDDPNYGRGWPSSRSWDNLTSTLARARAARAHPEVIEKIVRGTVGNANGIEFLSFMEKNDLPPIKSVLDDPSSWEPANQDRALATLGAIMGDARRRANESTNKLDDVEHWQKIGYTLKRLSDVGMGDLAAANAKEWLSMAPPGSRPPRDLLNAMSKIVVPNK